MSSGIFTRLHDLARASLGTTTSPDLRKPKKYFVAAGHSMAAFLLLG